MAPRPRYSQTAGNDDRGESIEVIDTDNPNILTAQEMRRLKEWAAMDAKEVERIIALSRASKFLLSFLAGVAAIVSWIGFDRVLALFTKH